MQFVKLFGERNTGTRAVARMTNALPHATTAIPKLERGQATDPEIERMIRETLPSKWRKPYLNGLKDDLDATRRGIGAWKHSAPVYDSSFAEHGTSVLFMVRNPYSWAVSFFRRPYAEMRPKSNTLEAFLGSPWLTIRRDRTRAVLRSPMELWSVKLKAYAEFKVRAERDGIPCQYLRFEDFLADPVAELSGKLRKLGVVPEGLEPIPQSTKPGGKPLARIQAEITAEAWRESLSFQAVELINLYLDGDLLEQFGYEKLYPDDFPDAFSQPSNREGRAAATG